MAHSEEEYEEQEQYEEEVEEEEVEEEEVEEEEVEIVEVEEEEVEEEESEEESEEDVDEEHVEIHQVDSERHYYGPTVIRDGVKVQAFSYQLSQATGQKKALLVGCNYPGTSGALTGCINDVFRIRDFLVNHFSYDIDNIVVLADAEDDNGNSGIDLPTREKMVEYMNWLVGDAEANDSLLFFYSGHGGQQDDLHGDEHDGKDECICPTDYQEAGVITDDELHELLVTPLPAGAGLTCLFDSCHSGSVVDLPWTYQTSGTIKNPEDMYEEEAEAAAVEASDRPRHFKWSEADVVSFSACHDSQTAPDAFGGESGGALSTAFITVLTATPEISYTQLLAGIQAEFEEKGHPDLKPQLSSSHPIDWQLKFVQ